MRFLLIGDKHTAKAEEIHTCSTCPMFRSSWYCVELKQNIPTTMAVKDGIWDSCRLPKEPR